VHHRIRTMLATVTLIAALPAASLAAGNAVHPKQRSSYVGIWRGGTNKVWIRTTGTGHAAKAKVWCLRAFQGTSPTFTITRTGRFSASRHDALGLEWRVKGRFTSPTTAVANVYLGIACSGNGSVKHLALSIPGSG
jgi:hypothetical protein